jgi:hypothetical protein
MALKSTGTLPVPPRRLLSLSDLEPSSVTPQSSLTIPSDAPQGRQILEVRTAASPSRSKQNSCSSPPPPRRETDESSFDWFKTYDQIKDLINRYIPDRTSSIVMLGCGNSTCVLAFLSSPFRGKAD